MKYLDLTLNEPEANLALDEALLDQLDNGLAGEVLRFWEPDGYFIVLGYANRIKDWVNWEACRDRQIPLFRRCSGGGAVVQGPGCLNYSLVLRLPEDGSWEGIGETNAAIMDRQKRALLPLLGPTLQVRGVTDLALGQRKFSGNAQRRRRHAILFHGSLLLNLDIPLVETLLVLPDQQPEYRERRSHGDFLANLNLPAGAIKQALRDHWGAPTMLAEIPLAAVNALMAEKYSRPEWNFKF